MDIPELNLLLVEDSDDDAFFFRRTLQKSGMACTIHHVVDGAEAIQFLQTASSSAQTLPPVMFLDLKMPILNGFEVLDWLQTQSFSDQIRVIVLSGSEHQGDKDRAAQLGAADYLVKPVQASDLDRLLCNVCPAKPQIGAHV